jgi:hypothetical protein
MITTPAVTDDQKLTWLHDTYVDLHHRARALERLIASTLTCRADPNSTPDSDGAPTVVVVRVDRDAWAIATDAATQPRPPYPAAFTSPPV